MSFGRTCELAGGYMPCHSTLNLENGWTYALFFALFSTVPASCALCRVPCLLSLVAVPLSIFPCVLDLESCPLGFLYRVLFLVSSPLSLVLWGLSLVSCP